MATASISFAPLLPFLEDCLGTEYSVNSDDIGCNSHAQIFRVEQRDSPDLKRKTPKYDGVVMKTPRNTGAVLALARESTILETIAGLFPLSVPCHCREGAQNTLPSSSPFEHSIYIPKLIRLEPSGLRPSPDMRDNCSNIQLTELLPGRNLAAIFPQLSFDEKMDTIQLLADTLIRLHSLDIPRVVATDLLRGFQIPLPCQHRQVATLSSREWLRCTLDTVLMPRLKDHPLFLTGSDSVSVESRGNKRTSRPFEAQKVFEAVDTIETYARKPDTDSYWSRFGSRESVLLHGDFMLPNILLSHTQAAETGYRKDKPHWYVSGLVDWGDCTIGDRRYDLSACVWSIRFNARLCGVNEKGADALAEAFLDRYSRLLHNKNDTPTQFRLITQEDLRPWRAVYELYGFLYY